ncbi:MAG TPA: Gfo/Idh/MocA family oxidoreductase [Acidimicrobiia bacterium]|nr:Gfo/Idh/MocA family oxidoreductase [Acidimicrobiia bacterium]
MRIGVIGVKGIGQAHLWALHGVDGSDLVAVCDVDAAAAEKNGADHNAAVFTDAEALFASGDVDAVVIATPPGTHAPLVRSALAAGMHVYCEKPFTPTADEGYELARYAKAVERTLQVGFQFRFHLGYAAMKNAVASIAPVRRVNVTATNWFRADKYFTASPWRGTWRVAGGGVLMAQAVHQVDALINAVGMPASVTGRVRAALHDVDAGLPLVNPGTMQTFVKQSMADRDLTMTLLVVFASLALILASLGVYSVMAYSVTQRSGEIGIRMALGARPLDVQKMVIRQGMKLAALGLMIGAGLALTLTRLLNSLLFEVSAYDPLTYVTITLILCAVAVSACWIPSRRASRIDPTQALHEA